MKAKLAPGTTVQFSLVVRDRLAEAAEERGLSVNFLVNRAVEQFLDRLLPVAEFRLTRDDGIQWEEE